MAGPPTLRWLAGIGIAAAICACAGGPVRSGDRYADANHGGSIVDLSLLDPRFERVRVEGTALAYADSAGTWIAWVRECRGQGDPRRLGQALLFQWRAQLVAERERAVHGAPGWWLEARAGDSELRAWTRAGPACSDDWLLVTRAAPGDKLELFERWVQSFEPGIEPDLGPGPGSADG